MIRENETCVRPVRCFTVNTFLRLDTCYAIYYSTGRYHSSSNTTHNKTYSLSGRPPPLIVVFLLLQLPGLIKQLVLIDVPVPKQTSVQPLAQPLLLRHSQHHDNGEMPHAGPKQAPRGALVAVVLPELPRLVGHPAIDHARRGDVTRVRDACETEADAHREHEQSVSQRDAAVARRVDPRQHAVSRGAVLVADAPGQGVEVRKLPCEEQRSAQPASRASLAKQQLRPCPVVGVLARRGGPAHQRRQAADHSTNPRVEHGNAFQRRVDGGVEDNVGEAEAGGGGIHAEEEGSSADGAADDGKHNGAAGGDELADERAVAGAGHLCVVLGLHEHVEGVCGRGAEGCAGGEEEEGEGRERRGGGRGGAEQLRDGVKAVCGCRGEDNEEREARLGEREVGEEEAPERRLRRCHVGEARRGIERYGVGLCAFWGGRLRCLLGGELFGALLPPPVGEDVFCGGGGCMVRCC